MRTALRFILVAAVFATAPAFAQQAGSPFQAQTQTFPFAATSSAGTPVQIVPNTGLTNYQNYLVSNTGANGAWVTLAFTSAAAVQTIPSGSTPGNAVWVEPGTSRVFTAQAQAWFNAQTATGTTVLNVTGGAGTLAGVAGSGVSGSSSGGATSNVNIQQVGGNAVTTSVPVSSIAPTDSYPTGGTITTQDVASTTVQGQFNQNQTTGTPTAGSTVSFSVAGFTTFTLGITNTWTGTVTLEGANAPGGVTTSTVWTEKTCRVPGTSRSTSNFTLNASDLLCNVSGYTNARIRATAAMTGTVTIGAAGESVNLHAFDLINPVKIVDGSGTSSTLTIKAASTAPLATDTAAVVAISPNSANITVTPSPLVVSTTDRSGTITLGGTAQNAMAANASRKGWCVQNPPTATEVLTVRANGTASAATGVILTAGSQACNSPGIIDQTAISVFAATTTHVFTAWEAQ